MDFDPDPLAGCFDSLAAEWRTLAHALGEFRRVLVECGYTRDEAFILARDHHDSFLRLAHHVELQPGVIGWPSLPPANYSEH